MTADELRRFRAGDPAAFAAVMRAYDGLIRGLAARAFASPFLQEEAVQEMWLQIFRRRDTLDVHRLASFPGWLKTVAKNRCIDLLRAERHRSREHASAILEDTAVSELSSARAVMARDHRRALDGFKAGLKNDQWRKFFVLCFEKELSYAEIGTLLGISVARCGYLKAAIIRRAKKNPAIRAALDKTPDQQEVTRAAS